VTDVTRALLIWLVLLAATAAIAAITGWSAWRTRNRHKPAALTGAEWDRLLAAERLHALLAQLLRLRTVYPPMSAATRDELDQEIKWQRDEDV